MASKAVCPSSKRHGYGDDSRQSRGSSERRYDRCIEALVTSHDGLKLWQPILEEFSYGIPTILTSQYDEGLGNCSNGWLQHDEAKRNILDIPDGPWGIAQI